MEIVPPLPGQRWIALTSNAFIYHALYHARWNGHYGFGTRMCDAIGRTEWADWQELQGRVYTGQRLASIQSSLAPVDRSTREQTP